MTSPVDPVEFVLETAAHPTAIRAAGVAAAAEVGADGVVSEVSHNASSVSYDVRAAGDGTRLMTLIVSWHELGAGRRRVTLVVRGHLVSRRLLLGRLPVGPATVRGIEPASRFSAALRARLADG